MCSSGGNVSFVFLLFVIIFSGNLDNVIQASGQRVTIKMTWEKYRDGTEVHRDNTLRVNTQCPTVSRQTLIYCIHTQRVSPLWHLCSRYQWLANKSSVYHSTEISSVDYEEMFSIFNVYKILFWGNNHGSWVEIRHETIIPTNMEKQSLDERLRTGKEHVISKRLTFNSKLSVAFPGDPEKQPILMIRKRNLSSDVMFEMTTKSKLEVSLERKRGNPRDTLDFHQDVFWSGTFALENRMKTFALLTRGVFRGANVSIQEKGIQAVLFIHSDSCDLLLINFLCDQLHKSI